MIASTILTLTLLFGKPDALVQIFSPTQVVSISNISSNQCVQVDPFLIQCWGEYASGMQVKVTWKCNDPAAIVVLRVDDFVRLYEMPKCLQKLYIPFL
jgi:hypothetical protein